MDLGTAASYFDNTPIEGWNGTSWDKLDQEVNLVVFDRFISDRNFGQRKRNATAGAAIPSQYGVIKLPGGLIYLIESFNTDSKHGERYSYVYLIHEASFTIDIVRMVEATARASGAGGAATPTDVATGVFADYERYNSVGSEQFENIRNNVYSLYLPKGTDLRSSDEVRLEGEMYTVRELSLQLDVVYARVVKRSDR
jgi:hypothetical protein